MQVALVHDYLNQRGGAERVFAYIAQVYPEAPIYTSLLQSAAVQDLFDVSRVRTSFLQALPWSREAFRLFAPLFPLAFERFDLRQYDLIVSSTTAWAKGVITRPDAVHVCYINTVSRFACDYEGYVEGLLGLHRNDLVRKLFITLTRPLIDDLIAWDQRAAKRPTAFIANSQNVAKRVKAFYGRDAYVLPCPVDIHSFYVGAGQGGYALVVSRLLPYKRVDIAIKACAQADLPLVVIGSGPAESSLRELARGTKTQFLGCVEDAKRAAYMADARVVLLPGEEDFGLVPVEAAAAGRPTIAYGAGGALETILEGETGQFFRAPESESLAAVLQTFDPTLFRAEALRIHAESYAPQKFMVRLRALVHDICAGHAANAPTHEDIEGLSYEAVMS